MIRSAHRFAFAFSALTIAGALLSAFGTSATAATAAATNGLAPQFSKWPIPFYPSHVQSRQTYAPNSYAIVTSDPRNTVVSWYRARLGSHALFSDHGVFPQILVDGGTYVINFEKSRTGTNINVLKNTR